MVQTISSSLVLCLEAMQQQSVTFQHAQLLQVRQAPAQQQAAQVATQQAELQKRSEDDATKRAQELSLVQGETDKQKQKSAHDANATKQGDLTRIGRWTRTGCNETQSYC